MVCAPVMRSEHKHGSNREKDKEKDEFIMKKLLEMDWSTRKIEQINRCRLFLNISRTSDIANAVEKNI